MKASFARFLAEKSVRSDAVAVPSMLSYIIKRSGIAGVKVQVHAQRVQGMTKKPPVARAAFVTFEKRTTLSCEFVETYLSARGRTFLQPRLTTPNTPRVLLSAILEGNEIHSKHLLFRIL